MFFLLACVEAEPMAPEASVSAATYEALAAPTADDLEDRTDVDQFGSVRFADGGPVVGTESDIYGYRDSYAVVEADSGVRVAAERGGVRLLLWVDRADLRPTLPGATWIGADGHRAANGAPGLQVGGGRYLEFNAEGQFASVHGDVDARVPVADNLLDEVYRSEPIHQIEGEGVHLLTGTEIVDDDGAVLGTTLRPWSDMRVVRREGGRALVEGTVGLWCGTVPTNVRGWVPERAVSDEVVTSWSSCCCCGGFGRGYGWGTSGPSKRVVADQLLYDAPDGSVIGIVTEDTTLGVDEEAGDMTGWTATLTHSQWGEVTTWVRETGGMIDDLVPPEAGDGGPSGEADLGEELAAELDGA